MAREVALGSSAHSIVRRLRAQNCGSTGAFCAVRLANSVTTTSTLKRRLRASALSARALVDRSALNLLRKLAVLAVEGAAAARSLALQRHDAHFLLQHADAQGREVGFVVADGAGRGGGRRGRRGRPCSRAPPAAFGRDGLRRAAAETADGQSRPSQVSSLAQACRSSGHSSYNAGNGASGYNRWGAVSNPKVRGSRPCGRSRGRGRSRGVRS